jgi:hypothetical protein
MNDIIVGHYMDVKEPAAFISCPLEIQIIEAKAPALHPEL